MLPRGLTGVGAVRKGVGMWLPAKSPSPTGTRSAPMRPRGLKGALILLFLGLPALAQTLTLGGYVDKSQLTPTLELSHPFSGFTFELRATREALGLGLQRALELGPIGRLAYGGLVALGPGGAGGRVFLQGGVGPVALEAALAYAALPWKALWVGENDPKGLSGRLKGRFRLSSREVLALSLAYGDAGLGLLPWGRPTWGLEGVYAFREGPTYTVGLGHRGGPYGLFGLKGELDEEGSVGEVLLRAGARTALEARLYTSIGEDALRLRLALAYPLYLALEGEWRGLGLEGACGQEGYALWLRYRWAFGSEGR